MIPSLSNVYNRLNNRDKLSNACLGSGQEKGWRVHGYGVPFRDDINVPKLIMRQNILKFLNCILQLWNFMLN